MLGLSDRLIDRSVCDLYTLGVSFGEYRVELVTELLLLHCVGVWVRGIHSTAYAAKELGVLGCFLLLAQQLFAVKHWLGERGGI